MTPSAKPYELTFETRPEYLYARVKSETQTVESSIEYLRETISKCREFRYGRLMIEKDIPTPLGTAQAFMIVSELAEMDVDGIRIALLDKRLENFEQNQFCILVGNNRGISTDVFVSQAAAEKWLLST